MTGTPLKQTGDYIPRKDAQFRDWGNNFIALLSLQPEHFGLTSSDVTIIANCATRFETALIATANNMRNKIAVKRKNEARRAAETVYRRYAQRIKRHPGVTSDEMISLGLHVDDRTKTPIAAPVGAPHLSATYRPTGNHAIRVLAEGDLKRRPPGVHALALYAAVGEWLSGRQAAPQAGAAHLREAAEMRGPAEVRGPAEIRGARRHVGSFGRWPITVEWPSELIGRRVLYFGRWVTATGLAGPWSPGVSLIITHGRADGCVLARTKRIVQPPLRWAA